jgi:hypothetical protein
MQVAQPPDQSASPSPRAARVLAWVAVGSMTLSVAVMVAVGLLGPSVAVPRFPSAAPWPPYFAAAASCLACSPSDAAGARARAT